MQEEIKTILERHVFIYDENNDKMYPEGVDKAAEAIVKLVQDQPVDRVQAMAALAKRHSPATYIVPGQGRVYAVLTDFSPPLCECGATGDCDHVKAVKIHREREKCNPKAE